MRSRVSSDDAEASPARQPEAVRARLEAQIAELVDGKAALDPARLHQEAVLIAARADIREELDRLRAHVDCGAGAAARGRRRSAAASISWRRNSGARRTPSAQRRTTSRCRGSGSN